MLFHRLLFAILNFLCMAEFALAVPADGASGSGKRKNSDHEDVQKAKQRKVQLEKSKSEYSKTWDEANKHVDLGHSGRKSWIRLWQQQKHQDDIARKYNLYGNLLKEDTQVQHGMHRVANDHTMASKKIQQRMDKVKEDGKISPSRAQQQNEEHYDRLLQYSTDIMEEDKKIHGHNRCRIIVECRPGYFQEYRKKQQKIRAARLKKSAAEIRLEDLRNRYHERSSSQRKADENDVSLYHSNRSKWIEKDMLQNKVEGNIRRHRLASMILDKKKPELRDVLRHRANELQKESEKLQKKKDKIKRKGFTDFARDDVRQNNFQEDNAVYDKFADKATNVTCRPGHFQEYRKKQRKIREARLKKSAAEIRLQDLEKKYRRRIQSENNADEAGVSQNHSNRLKWVRKDMEQHKLDASIKRHRLVGKLLRNQEIDDAMNHRANHLQNDSINLQKQKNRLKRVGFEDVIGHINKDREADMDEGYESKIRKCDAIIQREAKFNTRKQVERKAEKKPETKAEKKAESIKWHKQEIARHQKELNHIEWQREGLQEEMNEIPSGSSKQPEIKKKIDERRKSESSLRFQKLASNLLQTDNYAVSQALRLNVANAPFKHQKIQDDITKLKSDSTHDPALKLMHDVYYDSKNHHLLGAKGAWTRALLQEEFKLKKLENTPKKKGRWSWLSFPSTHKRD
ncbi:uncharacterized protein FA14DRAFT_178729 [Meira miltonrushii]|uniref:Trichohyalin n=1 Tax=Meira miltonrushii TaxID=1280837 RepID=A0A316VCJ8_9BASI|nr:uncharacterized protein FA14DRAFT_178729 [Meira miltonrushii]PWN35359.1 hypothetical protein FA14DRAFT_178729 [Meira miltonrushii]